MTGVSSSLTFPHISWWAAAIEMDTIILDHGAHFEKMTNRNRYALPGANNRILLSVPLVNGRNQHVAMKDVQIHNQERWQVQHWRTLVSVYRRSPYFGHYEPDLQSLFTQTYTLLTDFNTASILWVKQQLQLKIEIRETLEYVKTYPPEIVDIRAHQPGKKIIPKYYQVFEDRIGFMPDMSILDLLFSEGPFATDKLRAINQ